MLKDIQEADVVIAVSRREGIKVIKNRSGEMNHKTDMAGVLELLQPYQPFYLHSLLSRWIEKLKIYRIFG